MLLAVIAAALVLVGVTERAAPAAHAGLDPDIHIVGGNTVNAAAATGNTLSIEITGLSTDLKLYSVIAEYNALASVISVTSVVHNATEMPGWSCPGNSTLDGGGINSNLGLFAFESTCATTGAAHAQASPIVLFTVTFDCLASGSTAVSFDSQEGYTLASAESSAGALTTTSQTGTLFCTGAFNSPTPTSTAVNTPLPSATACSVGNATCTPYPYVRRTVTPTPTPSSAVPPTQPAGATEPPAPTQPGGGPAPTQPGGGAAPSGVRPPETGAGPVGGTTDGMRWWVVFLGAVGLAGMGGGLYALRRREPR
jgi:hypothetical protein